MTCAERDLEVLEFSPSQIKLAVVGTGSAEAGFQVQYMVRQLLALEDVPRPDHAADALAAAICYTTHEGFARRTGAACAVYDVPDRGILACVVLPLERTGYDRVSQRCWRPRRPRPPSSR